MNDRKQALIWLHDGKKVTFEGWHEDCYLSLERSYITVSDPKRFSVAFPDGFGWKLWEKPNKLEQENKELKGDIAELVKQVNSLDYQLTTERTRLNNVISSLNRMPFGDFRGL